MQLQIDITAGGLSPHITKMLISVIFLMVALSPIQERPNNAALVVMTALFVL